MTNQEIDERKSAALSRIIQATSTSGKFVIVASAMMGVLALFPDLQLPPEVAAVAGSIGVEALGNIIDRVAYKDDLSLEDIRDEVEKITNQSGIDELLTKDDFYHAFSHLLKKQKNQSKQNEEIFRIIQQIEVATSRFIDQNSGINNVNTEIDLDAYLNWLKTKAQIAASTIHLTTEEQSIVPDILNYAVTIDNEINLGTPNSQQNLFETVSELPHMVVVGDSGCGKSTALWQLALYHCEGSLTGSTEAKIPVYIDLAGYDGESISNLIHQSFQSASLPLADQVIENNANEGTLLLLLDDFDLAMAENRSDLLKQLKKWKATHPNCSLVITTHQPRDGHRLGLPTFRIQSLSITQANQILLNFKELKNRDLVTILNSLPPESQHLVENPLTLRMIAYVYIRSGEHRIPSSRGLLYQEVVDGIMHLGEAKGKIEFERSDKLLLICLLAKWMLDNEKYRFSPTQISGLIHQWIHDNTYSSIAHLHDSDPIQLRLEIIQSGFFQTALNGDAQFSHSTFRDYFAALTITQEQLSSLLSKQNWHTSILLWSSLVGINESDHLIEMLVNNPLFLAQVMRERTENRPSRKFDTADEKTYFEHLGRYFLELVNQFSGITTNSYLEEIAQNGIKLIVARSSSNDYAVLLQPNSNYNALVEWVTSRRLHEQASYVDDKMPFPLPMWLLPVKVVQSYHPLEAIYLWARRALFDQLNFIGIAGGIDETQIGQSYESHPAIALIASRYLLYQMLADKLPVEISIQLPFFARSEYDLCIEVHDYIHPYIVHYAIMPARNEGKIAIIQSILKDMQEPSMFVQNEEGYWTATIAGERYSLANVETVQMSELMTQSAGYWATRHLMDELEQFLPGFPPEAW